MNSCTTGATFTASGRVPTTIITFGFVLLIAAEYNPRSSVCLIIAQAHHGSATPRGRRRDSDWVTVAPPLGGGEEIRFGSP
ncbi:MAG: hypothetical protein AMXMBFR20_27660 [Planctomycetia bacterium]